MKQIMKQTKKMVFRIAVIAIMLLTFSCGKDKKESVILASEQKEASTTDVDLDQTKERTEVVFADETITKIYAQYLLVKKGLVNSNHKLVQQEAKKLEALIAKTEETNILKANAKLISLTKDVKKQRDFFVTMTAETEKLIDNANITSGEVYKQFCPMAFEGAGGYWLSDSKEVRNPYYGKKMLVCGEVNKTIQ